MTLDDFKIRLNQQLETNDSFEMPVTGITNLHELKTNSVLEKLKKSLQFEIVFGLLFVAAFLFLAFHSSINNIKIYFGFFSIVIAFFVGILIYLLSKTQQVNISQFSVKQHLISLHNLLSQFVKRCFQFTMLLIPVCFVSALYLAYNDMQYHTTNSVQYFDIPLPKKYIIILLVVIVGFTVFMYYFTKWYLKKLYGNNLQQLKQMIDEIDAD